MYGIVMKEGRGSWKMAQLQIFDDREKAEHVARQIASHPDRHSRVICKVVYLGDSIDW